MMVAADPMLLDTARPIRKGMGFNLALRRVTVSTGANTRHTMSLTNIAENQALVTIMTKRNLSGLSMSRVILIAIQV